MTAPGRDLLLGALVLASLAGNVVLLARWQRGQAGPASGDAARGQGERARAGKRDGDRGAVRPPSFDTCAARASALRNELAALERPVHPTPPASRRFQEAAPNQPLTAALADELARHLSAAAPAPRMRGECRGSWCRLEVSGDGREAPALASFVASAWVAEHLHEVERSSGAILFERHQPGSLRSSVVLQQALHDFEASGAVEACQARHRDEGTLAARIALTPSEPVAGEVDSGITVETSGPLAPTMLGRCIDGELRRALAAVSLPPRYEHASLLAHFPRP
jgi:hypothetical protein